MDPIEDISPDFTKEVWNQQNIALVNHLLVQLNLDVDDTLAAARVVLVNVELVDESDPSTNDTTKDEMEKEARISETGRKALTVIGLIIAFLVAMGIGVWCISPFDGYDEGDNDGSHFGKPRESFSQAATDEIQVDHDEIQSVTSSLTGAPREDDLEDRSMMDDPIYLREFVPESRTTQCDNRIPSQDYDDDDDQDSFYSNVPPYFYKTAGAHIASPSLSSMEPSVYSVWKDPERKQHYESLRYPTNSNSIDNDETEERIIQITTTNRRNDESTITSNSMFLTEESTTGGGSVSLSAAPSRARTTPLPPASLSLSESLRLRIASHLAEELLHE